MMASLYADCQACNDMDQGQEVCVKPHDVRNSDNVERKSRRAKARVLDRDS